jgi:hypothetical protein
MDSDSGLSFYMYNKESVHSMIHAGLLKRFVEGRLFGKTKTDVTQFWIELRKSSTEDVDLLLGLYREAADEVIKAG